MEKIENNYIYKATSENLKVFKDHPRKLMSDDKKYILVYSEKYLQEIYDYYDWLTEQDRFGKFSQSDWEYDYLLLDLGIKKPFEADWYITSTLTPIDELKTIIIKFQDSKTVFGAMLCNKEDLNQGKAIATFIQLAYPFNYVGKSVKDVKDVKAIGYFTFLRKGTTHEGK
jgi:hypothetical protein